MIIVKSEIEGLKTSISKQLSNDADDADILLGTTGNFVTTLSNTQNFLGGYRDKILKNLDEYKDAITKRKELAIELSTKITDSLNEIINSMDEDTIDTSKKESLINSLEKCKNSLATMYDRLNLPANEELTAEMISIQKSIYYYEGQINYIENEIHKIEKVEQADAQALSKLNGLEDMIVAYQSLTVNIEAEKSNIPTSSPEGVYVAAQN